MEAKVPAGSENHVRDYYNTLTGPFLRAGGATARTGSMHRTLRVRDRSVDPIRAVDLLVLRALEAAGAFEPQAEGTPERHVIADLGCGTGASMAWLSRRAHAEVVGITLSQAQAAAAATLFPALTPPVVGSYDSVSDLERMSGGRLLSGAYMIESFVHAPDAERLLRAIAERTRPGGALVICDDLPTERLATALASGTGEERSRALAQQFRAGWHVQTFLSPRQIAKVAARTGWKLIRSDDLSACVATYRPRDLVARVGSWYATVLRLRSSWWDNVTGGSALQRLIHRRAVRYRLLTLQRVA